MQRERSESTREALIQSTIRVIGARGFAGLTVRAVAAEAGVTHGMIVHHFGTRDRLVESAIEYAVERSIAGALPSPGEVDRPQLGDHVVEVGRDTRGEVAFQREILNAALRNPELGPLAERIYRQYEAAVSRQLAEAGVNDPAATVLVGAAMDGLVRRQMDLGDEAATENALRLLNELVARLAVPAR